MIPGIVRAEERKVTNMRSKLVVVFGLGVAWAALPLPGADGLDAKVPKQSFEVTSTERVNFLPGGTIRLVNSYGYVTVEGWDEPEVEVTVTKSTNHFFDPEKKAEAERRLKQVHVVIERRSATELAISTTPPARNPLIESLAPNSRRGVTVDYGVRVPRDSRLVIHQDAGYVWVSDVTGDIDANSRTGDMIVLLPDPGPYLIDARTRLGSVSSDFIGKGHYRFVAGTHFAYGTQTPPRRIHLRMGCGSITIKKGPPSGPFWKD